MLYIFNFLLPGCKFINISPYLLPIFVIFVRLFLKQLLMFALRVWGLFCDPSPFKNSQNKEILLETSVNNGDTFLFADIM